VRKTLCEDVPTVLLVLHQRGIVHGDLKLENSLVFSTNEEGSSCRVKLSDFGGALVDSDGFGVNFDGYTSMECNLGGMPTGQEANLLALVSTL
jgi:serine/threonine protein kinase